MGDKKDRLLKEVAGLRALRSGTMVVLRGATGSGTSMGQLLAALKAADADVAVAAEGSEAAAAGERKAAKGKAMARTAGPSVEKGRPEGPAAAETHTEEDTDMAGSEGGKQQQGREGEEGGEVAGGEERPAKVARVEGRGEGGVWRGVAGEGGAVAAGDTVLTEALEGSVGAAQQHGLGEEGAGELLAEVARRVATVGEVREQQEQEQQKQAATEPVRVLGQGVPDMDMGTVAGSECDDVTAEAGECPGGRPKRAHKAVKRLVDQEGFTLDSVPSKGTGKRKATGGSGDGGATEVVAGREAGATGLDAEAVGKKRSSPGSPVAAAAAAVAAPAPATRVDAGGTASVAAAPAESATPPQAAASAAVGAAAAGPTAPKPRTGRTPGGSRRSPAAAPGPSPSGLDNLTAVVVEDWKVGGVLNLWGQPEGRSSLGCNCVCGCACPALLAADFQDCAHWPNCNTACCPCCPVSHANLAYLCVQIPERLDALLRSGDSLAVYTEVHCRCGRSVY